MSDRFQIALGLRSSVIVLTLAAAACGGKSNTVSAGASATATAAAATSAPHGPASDQAAATTKPAPENNAPAARAAQPPVQPLAKPVDMDALRSMLPEVTGWKRVNSSAEMISLPSAYSLARARYSKDASLIDLEIKDTALSPVLLGPQTMFMSNGAFESKSDDGYRKAITFGGQPAYEDWNTPAKSGEIAVIVGGRFVVSCRGRAVASLDPVRAVLDTISFAKLAKLK